MRLAIIMTLLATTAIAAPQRAFVDMWRAATAFDLPQSQHLVVYYRPGVTGTALGQLGTVDGGLSNGMTIVQGQGFFSTSSNMWVNPQFAPGAHTVGFTSGYSYAAWIYQTASNASHIIAGDYSRIAVNSAGFNFRVLNGRQIMAWAVNDALALRGRQSTNFPVSISNWHHVAFTKNFISTVMSNQDFRVYVDGVRVDATDFTSGIITTNPISRNSLYIGAGHIDSAAAQFPLRRGLFGYQDESTLWATNLTQDEIIMHMNATRGTR